MHPGGRPPLYNSAEEMDSLIEEYFNDPSVMFVNGDGQVIFRPTMAGLAYHLGMDRRSLLNYSKKEEFFPSIKRAKDRVEAALEANLYNNSVTGTIFNLKNNFGWVDKTEQERYGKGGEPETWKVEFVNAASKGKQET